MTLAGPMMHSTTDNLAFLLRVTVKKTSVLHNGENVHDVLVVEY